MRKAPKTHVDAADDSASAAAASNVTESGELFYVDSAGAKSRSDKKRKADAAADASDTQ